MPASRTKEVRTPKPSESLMSEIIRRFAGQDYGPDWANQAPQSKVTKMRKYPKGREGTVMPKQDRLDIDPRLRKQDRR